MAGRLATLLDRDAGRTLVRLASKASAEGDRAAAELLVDLAYVAFDIQYSDAPELESQVAPAAPHLAHASQLIVAPDGLTNRRAEGDRVGAF
jgi:hypothetical protein